MNLLPFTMCVTVLFAPMLAPAASAAPAGKPSASLCDPAAEETVFQCRAGKKLVAVCASQNWSHAKGFLQYRYGTPGAVELRIPESASTPPEASARVGTITLSGGGGAMLRFKSGDYNYTVFSVTSASLGDKAGVLVEAHGKRVASVKCKGGEPDTDLDLNAILQAGLLQDDEPITLP